MLRLWRRASLLLAVAVAVAVMPIMPVVQAEDLLGPKG
jgi:hypothetical protein